MKGSNAGQASTSLPERDLLEAQLRYTENLRAINALGRALAETFDIDAIYDQVRRYIYAVLPDISGVMINLFDSEKQVITAAYCYTDDAVQDVSSLPPIPLAPDGEGTQSRVIRTRQPLVIDHFQEQLKKARIRVTVGSAESPLRRSAMYVPMLTQGKVVGLIVVQSPVEERFSESDVELTWLIANTAAVAIENARLHMESQRRVRELEVLYDSGLAFSSLLQPREIGEKIIEALSWKLKWHHATVRLLHPEDGTLELLAFSHPGVEGAEQRRLIEQRFRTMIARVGQGLSGWVVQHGQAVRCGDVMNDDRYLETVEGIRSGLYVPVKSGDHMLGVIAVESEEPEAFSESDERLLTTLAAQAAIAFENARLFEEIRRRMSDLEDLNLISADLRGAQTRSDMPSIILDHLVGLLQAGGAALAMRDPESGETVIELARGGWEAWTGIRLAPGEGISGHVIATGQPYVSDDAAADPREAYPDLIGNLRAVVCIPLIAHQQIVGALWFGREHGFVPEEVRFLTTVADIAASALYRAELLETLERRVAERTRELAEANERLTELDRLKSKFVSDVSHELRTPVTTISLYLGLLEHGKPEKHREYLGILRQETARLAQLIEDILDLSRLERASAETTFAPVDLSALIKRVIAVHRPRAETAGLALMDDVEPNLPPVLGNAEQLGQVLTNLVANAINYTRVGWVRVSARVIEGRVLMEVKDTGIGIDASDLPHLFERFYRGRDAAQMAPGSGLGLSIVKEIIDRHGGTVEVDSRPGEGSTFRVWLAVSVT